MTAAPTVLDALADALTAPAAADGEVSLDLTRDVLDTGEQVTAVVHLSGGQITGADPSAAPGVVQRLLGAAAISREDWAAARSDDDGHTVAERLQTRHGVSGDLLTRVVRSVVVDALLDLTRGHGAVTVTPLGAGGDWLGAPARLAVGDVLGEVADRAARHRGPVLPVSAVVRAATGLPRGPVRITREQWRIAREVRGRSVSVGELARRSGLALYDTRHAVATLLHAGLCVLPGPGPDTPAVGVPGVGVPSVGVPVQGGRAAGPASGSWPAAPPLPAAPPSPELPPSPTIPAQPSATLPAPALPASLPMPARTTAPAAPEAGNDLVVLPRRRPGTTPGLDKLLSRSAPPQLDPTGRPFHDLTDPSSDDVLTQLLNGLRSL